MTRSASLINRATISMAYFILMACSGQNGSGERVTGEGAEVVHDSAGQAHISFQNLEHDFGTIIEGEMVVCYFEYTNEGKGDLVIRSVEVSCGCTTPDWSSEPLRPGGTERLKVIFDASGRSGVQRKVVTVRSNAANPSVRLTVKAEVQSNV